MSQHTARHDPHAKSRDEDVDDMRARRPEPGEGVQPRQPAGDGVGPDGPQEDEFELIGDDDLGAADLGPLGPHADPDAPWAKPRRMPPKKQQ
jgi:hypothetical protein